MRFVWLTALLMLNTATLAETGAARESSRTEALLELDPYYSSASLEIPLTSTPVPDGGQLREVDVYRSLFRDSLKPRLLMLEASVYPLPWAGTWFKEENPEGYRKFDISEVGSNQLNLIDGLTAGFQEPWALSAFVGSSMRFSTRADTGNRGYMGYLLSAGARHIHNNVMIEDHWWEFEWKLKGERRNDDEDLSWSFRLGFREHGNPDIRDVVYLGIRRSNLDYDAPFLGFLRNSNLEMLSEFSQQDYRFLRQEITVGKKLPFSRHHIALALDLGLVYENQAKYTGVLQDPTADKFTVVFRPHLNF